MHRLAKPLALACVLALSACVAPMHGVRPQPVASQADTFRFRIHPYAFAAGGYFADRALDEELMRFRLANGYGSSEVLSRDWRDGAYVYTVRFARSARVPG